jgi:hypothetical protein
MKKYKIKEEESLKYLSSEEMSKECRVLIGLPCFGGNMTMETCQGLLQISQRAQQKNIRVDCHFIANESLIPRARNRIVAHFLASMEDYTHLMFIDVDGKFSGDDLFKLLHYNKDIVGGPVSTKGLPPRHVLEVKGMEEGKLNCTADKKLVELSNIGSAFYMIKRRVFEEMVKAYPELHCDPRVPIGEIQSAEMEMTEGSTYYKRYLSSFYTLYDTGLSNSLGLKEDKDQSKGDVYLSEDYVFAERWKKIGGKMWIDPRIKIGHMGRFEFFSPCMQNFPRELWLPEDYQYMMQFEEATKTKT